MHWVTEAQSRIVVLRKSHIKAYEENRLRPAGEKKKKGGEMLTQRWHHGWERKKKKKTELHMNYTTDLEKKKKKHTTARAFNQITNCNKLPAGRNCHKSKPAALLGNWLQIFFVILPKTALSLASLPQKRPCPQILIL